MQALVITILDNEESVEAAARCIKSGDKHLTEVKMFPAVTPSTCDVSALMKEEGIPEDLFFKTLYSKPQYAMAAFMSHYSLWKKSIEDDIPILILEHDAIFMNFVPDVKTLGKVTSLGAPSYGSFNTPKHIGLGPLTSKPYFPGAHGYVVKPEGAKELVEKAKICGQPTDVFLCRANFPDIKEYYPWCIEARDTFTTIQQQLGCEAKHSYKKDPKAYKLIYV